MIPHAEILALRDEWGPREDVVEKDYALGWLLGAIASQPELTSRWVFKGGTCLRKCFYETCRFSEDLDFTVVDDGPETAEELLPIRGPRNPPNLPKVKIDLTGDEVLAGPTDQRRVLHPYSDATDLTVEVTTYGIIELLAEKIRALVERCRPRDLYDVINVYRHPELIQSPADVREALRVKCEHAGWLRTSRARSSCPKRSWGAFGPIVTGSNWSIG